MKVGIQQLPIHHPNPASNVLSGLIILLAKSAAMKPDLKAYDNEQNIIGIIILYIIFFLAVLRTCEKVGRDNIRLYTILLHMATIMACIKYPTDSTISL